MNQATTGKDPEPLSMAKILEGTGLLSPSPISSTYFTVTVHADAVFKAQVAWVKKMLPKWGELLEKKSGTHLAVTDLSGKFPDERIEFDDDYKTNGGEFHNVRLIAHLWIKGAINNQTAAHPRMRRMLAGQIKKVLYEEIMANFPPPFNYKNPGYAAGVKCIFSLRNGYNPSWWTKKEMEKINDKQFYKQLDPIFSNKGAELIQFSAPQKRTGTIILSFKFKTDTTYADVRKLEKNVLEFFEKKPVRNCLDTPRV